MLQSLQSYAPYDTELCRNKSPSHSTRGTRGGFLYRPAKPEAFVERLLPVVFHSFNILYLVDNLLILMLGLEVHGEADDGTNSTSNDGANNH